VGRAAGAPALEVGAAVRRELEAIRCELRHGPARAPMARRGGGTVGRADRSTSGSVPWEVFPKGGCRSLPTGHPPLSRDGECGRRGHRWGPGPAGSEGLRDRAAALRWALVHENGGVRPKGMGGVAGDVPPHGSPSGLPRGARPAPFHQPRPTVGDECLPTPFSSPLRQRGSGGGGGPPGAPPGGGRPHRGPSPPAHGPPGHPCASAFFLLFGRCFSRTGRRVSTGRGRGTSPPLRPGEACRALLFFPIRLYLAE